MIKLIKFAKDEYVVYSADYNEYVVGTLKEAVRALRGLGIADTEVEYALELFATKGDNIADFGINGTLIFTDKENRLSRMAA